MSCVRYVALACSTVPDWKEALTTWRDGPDEQPHDEQCHGDQPHSVESASEAGVEQHGDDRSDPRSPTEGQDLSYRKDGEHPPSPLRKRNHQRDDEERAECDRDARTWRPRESLRPR